MSQTESLILILSTPTSQRVRNKKKYNKTISRPAEEFGGGGASVPFADRMGRRRLSLEPAEKSVHGVKLNRFDTCTMSVYERNALRNHTSEQMLCKHAYEERRWRTLVMLNVGLLNTLCDLNDPTYAHISQDTGALMRRWIGVYVACR